MVLRDTGGNEFTVRYLPAVRQVSCAGFESAKRTVIGTSVVEPNRDAHPRHR
jgi:hypothetical protein